MRSASLTRCSRVDLSTSRVKPRLMARSPEKCETETMQPPSPNFLSSTQASPPPPLLRQGGSLTSENLRRGNPFAFGESFHEANSLRDPFS